MHHSCALSGLKQPEKLTRQHLFPLSIKDGEGARGSYKYRFFGRLISERWCVSAFGVSVRVAAPFPADAAAGAPLRAWAVSWAG